MHGLYTTEVCLRARLRSLRVFPVMKCGVNDGSVAVHVSSSSAGRDCAGVGMVFLMSRVHVVAVPTTEKRVLARGG